MKITFHKSYFAPKPHTVKFSKSVCTFTYEGSGITGGNLYKGQSSLMTYCFVFHFLWWSVMFNMEETEGWGSGYYEEQYLAEEPPKK